MSTSEYEKSKKVVDTVAAFCKREGIAASFCQGCKVWTVHCPECGTNYCGSGCQCGYDEFMRRKIEKLDEAISKEEIARGASKPDEAADGPVFQGGNRI